jgi:nucleoside-diphosphate-sugar epimerase
MKILITGSEGFVGKQLVSSFLSNAHDVFGIDRIANPSNSYNYNKIDMRQQFTLPENEWDVVIHCAAAKGDWGISDQEFYLDNVVVTRNLIQYLKECTVNKIIHFSTVAIYDRIVTTGDEETLIKPDSVYGSTKLESEILMTEFVQSNKIKTIILRPSVIYGRNNYANMFNLIKQLSRNLPFQVNVNGIVKSHVSVTNVSFVVKWFVDTKYLNCELDIYNLTERPYLNLIELNKIICTELKVRTPYINIPRFFVKIGFRCLEYIGKILKKDVGFTVERFDKFTSSTNYTSERLWNIIGTQRFSSESELIDMVKWFKEIK